MPPISRDQAPAARTTMSAASRPRSVSTPRARPPASRLPRPRNARGFRPRRRGKRRSAPRASSGSRPDGRCGCSTAAAMPGFRCGSQAARLGRVEPFEVEPEPLLEFVGMAQVSASSRLSATTSVPSSRYSTEMPLAASSSRAKSGHRRWLSRVSGSSGSSPGSVSTAAASIPAAAQLAPRPAAPLS
jgi:hypothetical protein